MATLVLSTVGTLLGGPVGGAIGSLLGQSIDQQLFGPGPREGPRLGDLSVQTSSYGTAIPRIFGTMRVAGSIVWSTDLQEDSETQGAKGQPETVTYSYSASFAVALSSRRISNIGRIWADGKLVRTAEGEFTVSTGFRFYDGSENQPVDPLIATIEGIDLAPAYRGTALALFEHLQLAEFGNRIPFLTFEVEADPGAVPVSLVLADVSGGAIASSESSAVAGYAAHGGTIASAVEPLVETFGVSLFDDGTVLTSPAVDIVPTATDELGCSASDDPRPRSERSQVASRNLPSALSLSYYDPAREYQAGMARAAIDSDAARDERMELPAVLQASAAKGLAEASLGRRWAERDKLTLHLPPSFLAVRPGTLLQPPNALQPWKAARVTVESMAVTVELRPLYARIDTVPADPGRVLPSLGVEPTPTTVAVVELPDDGSGSADAPVVAVATSTASPTWRSVPLEVEVGGLGSVLRLATSQAQLGLATTVLEPGQVALLDLMNDVEVELVSSDQWLESRDDGALADGSNLALLGMELIQFGEAIPTAPGRFRLRRLLRGRRGTEWAMELHQAGELFLMLDPRRLERLPLTSSHVGSQLRIVPRGLADTDAQAAELVVSGEAMRPPSPVHVRASFAADGSLRCKWVRRSRRGWAWLDGVDAPLDCLVERYRVRLQSGGGVLELETSVPEAQFSAQDLSALGSGTAELSVTQLGDLGISRSASLTINLS